MLQLSLATTEDLNTVVDFAQKFHANSVYKNSEFNRDKVTLFIEALLRNANKSIVILLKEEEKFVGALIGHIEETIFGLDLLSTELMYWVEEEYRGKDSWRLVEAYEYWAKKLGCTMCSLSRLEDVTGDKLDKKYVKEGFNPWEHTYVKVF